MLCQKKWNQQSYKWLSNVRMNGRVLARFFVYSQLVSMLLLCEPFSQVHHNSNFHPHQILLRINQKQTIHDFIWLRAIWMVCTLHTLTFFVAHSFRLFRLFAHSWKHLTSSSPSSSSLLVSFKHKTYAWEAKRWNSTQTASNKKCAALHFFGSHGMAFGGIMIILEHLAKENDELLTHKYAHV